MPVLYRQAGIRSLTYAGRFGREGGQAAPQARGASLRGAAEPAPAGPGCRGRSRSCRSRADWARLFPLPPGRADGAGLREPFVPAPAGPGCRGRSRSRQSRAQRGPVSSAAAPPGGRSRAGWGPSGNCLGSIPGLPTAARECRTAGACLINRKILTNSLPSASYTPLNYLVFSHSLCP